MSKVKFVTARFLIVAIVCMIVYLAFDSFARGWVNSSASSFVGWNVHVGRVQTEWRDRTVKLQDVTLGDGASQNSSRLQLKELSCELDPSQLLRKKLIVDKAVVVGLQLKIDRPSADGELPFQRIPTNAEQTAAIARRKIDAVIETVGRTTPPDLRIVRVSNDIEQRRRRNFSRIVRHAQELQQQMDQLKSRPAGEFPNPLRDSEILRRRVRSIVEMRKSLQLMRSEVKRMESLLTRDHEAIVAEKAADIQNVGLICLTTDLSEKSLSAYLFADECDDLVRQLVGWLNWSRQFSIEARQAANGANRHELGRPKPTYKTLPDLLFRELKLSGDCELNARVIRLDGVARGITSQPKVFGEPVQIALRVYSPDEWFVDLTVDRTEEVPRDRLSVEIPSMQRPAVVLGQSSLFAVSFGPRRRSVKIEASVDGDALQGKIVFHDEVSNSKMLLRDQNGDDAITRDLGVAVSSLGKQTVEINLSGTIVQPNWEVKSNLGQVVASGLNSKMKQTMSRRRDLLALKIEGAFRAGSRQVEALQADLERLASTTITTAETNVAQLERSLNRRFRTSGSLR